MPVINNNEKEIHLQIFNGIISLKRNPIISEVDIVSVLIRVIKQAVLNGIFILFNPYPKHATKASREEVSAININSKNM